MKETIAGLTDNEILFCEKWEQVIKRKWDIRTDDLQYCYNLVFSDKMTNTCPDCLRRYASTVNNYFNRIRDTYNKYKEDKNKPPEPVVKEPIVEKKLKATPKKQVVNKQVVKKKKVVKASGRSYKNRKEVTKKDDNINLI